MLREKPFSIAILFIIALNEQATIFILIVLYGIGDGNTNK